MRPLLALLILALAATGAAQTREQASLAAKQQRSPIDPALAAWANAPSSALRAAQPADTWPYLVRDGGIVIHAASKGDVRALLAELEAIGLSAGSVSGNTVSGVLPFDALAGLAASPSLAVARPAMATTQRELAALGPGARGSVVSQGVAAMRAAHLPRGVDGSGTRVGILADSFDCRGGRAQDTASGDLPADVAILDDTNRASCTDEGRALAQIVHDVAPRSGLGFHTGFNGIADFAAGIRALASGFRADVIVDDVLYFDEPFFQDGVVARAVDDVHDHGVVYVSAAGNADHRSYEAPFRNSGQTGFYQALGETRRHDFDPGPGVDVFQNITVPPFASTVLVMQWDEPFVSASTANPPVGAASDYDLMIYRTETPTPGRFFDVFASSDSYNPGGDPIEALVLRNPTAQPLQLYLAIERFIIPGADGPDVDRLRILEFGTPIEHEWSEGDGGTSFGHANARGALAVGAAGWFDTPRFGVRPPLLEPFSSAGGIPILIDGAGQRLPRPIVRQTPDVVAPDGVNTTFFGGDIAEDDDSFPNFFGTSAAAPHAAGVAALLAGRAREVAADARCAPLSPDRIERLLEGSAIDMAAPGFDFDTGYGLLDARAALASLSRWLGEQCRAGMRR